MARVLEQGSHEALVERVSATFDHHVAFERNAQQCQVADEIERLVPDELVGPAQTVAVEDARDAVG